MGNEEIDRRLSMIEYEMELMDKRAEETEQRRKKETAEWAAKNPGLAVAKRVGGLAILTLVCWPFAVILAFTKGFWRGEHD